MEIKILKIIDALIMNLFEFSLWIEHQFQIVRIKTKALRVASQHVRNLRSRKENVKTNKFFADKP